jgi:hypothetical protein
MPCDNKGVTVIQMKKADKKNSAENKNELLYMLLSAFIPLDTVTPFRLYLQ